MDKKNKNVTIKIGDILRKTRKSLGLTQEDVAEKLNLASRYISDIERNRVKGSIDTLVGFCNVYHVTPTYILQEYLKVNEELKVDSNIIGYYNLSDYNKKVIVDLIEIMHKDSQN